MDVDDYDFPVCLAVVQESHCAESFDLFDLPWGRHILADLAGVKRIIVTLVLSVRVDVGGIFPSLVKEYTVNLLMTACRELGRLRSGERLGRGFNLPQGELHSSRYSLCMESGSVRI